MRNIVLISGEREGLPPVKNAARTLCLFDELQESGWFYGPGVKRYGITVCRGVYAGVPETSFAVSVDAQGGAAGRQQIGALAHIAWNFEQECILHVDCDGQAYLHYCDGREPEHIGAFEQSFAGPLPDTVDHTATEHGRFYRVM